MAFPVTAVWVFPANVHNFSSVAPTVQAPITNTHTHTYTFIAEYIIDNPFYLSKRALISYV